MSNPLTTETRFMRTSEVLSKTGIKSRSTLYALEAAGKFPARVFITNKAVGFIEAEIAAWMEQRIAARPAPLVISAFMPVTAPRPIFRARLRRPAAVAI